MAAEHDLAPTCLLVPGLDNSGPGHWQTVWEQQRTDCRRVQLGLWDDPNRNVWISRIDQAVSSAEGPVILVAHSLGCQAVAWWAALLGPSLPGKVIGALLVAPPDVERPGTPESVARFAPTPRVPLAFPTIVVASTDDGWCSPEAAQDLATAWNAAFVLLEGEGHINAASGVGDWIEGQALLDRLSQAPQQKRRSANAVHIGGASGAAGSISPLTLR
jgi:uncharacterized protein